MHVVNVLKLLIIISVTKLGVTLNCYECIGSSCEDGDKNKNTCNSENYCYLTVDNDVERRGCEGTVSCNVQQNGVGNSVNSINNDVRICQICSGHLCNGNTMGLRKVSCYQCEGDECNSDDGSIRICEASTCFFIVVQGMEKRGCGQSSATNYASNDVKFSCTGDRCNSKAKYEEFQLQMKNSMDKLNNDMGKLKYNMQTLQNTLAENQQRFQLQLNENMKNLRDRLKNLFR